jgi:glycosyltransferase involved in cell wall biosynthesis
MATIHLILWDNGVGLARDMQILSRVWTELGHEVFVTAYRRGTLQKWLRPVRLRGRMLWQRWRGDDPDGRFDYNVMLEHVRPEYLPLARRNVLVPNPEWFGPENRASLQHLDRVLTKTHHAQALFAGYGIDARYMGFTSADRARPGGQRRGEFFHLAGRSDHKGTAAVIQLWLRHPEWPTLTVVQHPRKASRRIVAPNIVHRIDYLSDVELQRLQNEHAFHLCPSETEGFGHYIVEAMSVGAVTLTTDAPPMNEIVRPDRGLLISYARTGCHGAATTYQFSEEAMAQGIDRALGMSAAERSAMGENARRWFEQNDREFRRRAGEVLGPAGWGAAKLSLGA